MVNEEKSHDKNREDTVQRGSGFRGLQKNTENNRFSFYNYLVSSLLIQVKLMSTIK